MATVLREGQSSVELSVDTTNGDSYKQMLVTVWIDAQGKPVTVGIAHWRLTPNALRELADKVENLLLIDRRA